MQSIRFFSALFSILFLGANGFALEGNIPFDQNGSVSKIVNRLKTANSDTDIIPIPSLYKNAAKKWTVMVFVNAKNNLEEYGLMDINEMEMVGSGDDINIVAELGRIGGHSNADGNWKGSRRYLIKKDDNKHDITSPALMKMAKTDMGDWNHLVDFAKWSMEKFPARHYMLIVWNHGGGWKKSSGFELTKGISYDDETGNHMTTPQLKMAMEKIGKIDILAMDACLMQMAEVAYEIKDYADYIVGSEETILAYGYPYDTFLGSLVKNPDMGIAELSKVTIDSFVDYYESDFMGSMLSSIKTSVLDKFRVLIDGWVKAAVQANEKEAVITAKNEAKSFAYSENKDLYHFVKLAAKNASDEDFIKKSNDLLKFMDDELIAYNRAYSYSGMNDNAHGLAVYLPDEEKTSYNKLQWAKDSQWDKFIKWYND